jgi:uncharacterized protein YdhG (YjbR/CyaY superfamily)
LKKPKKQFKTIDEYISSFPKNVQDILQQLRQIIRDSAPNSSESISYQIPTFKLNGNLVHFAAYKNHIGFYPTPSGVSEFREELSEYEIAKGSVKFPLNKPLPINLITEIVKFRVKENLDEKK